MKPVKHLQNEAKYAMRFSSDERLLPPLKKIFKKKMKRVTKVFPAAIVIVILCQLFYESAFINSCLNTIGIFIYSKKHYRTMLRKLTLFLAGTCIMAGAAHAQLRCGTDEVYRRMKAADPQIAITEAQQEAFLYDKIMVHPVSPFSMRGTEGAPDTTKSYDLTVVFHIIHDYGAEYISDQAIYTEVTKMNEAYSRTADYTGVILPYAGTIPGTKIKYIGNAKMRFHLATKDPDGNPTNGITRRQSFITNHAGDEAKLDIWPIDRYINIWLINTFSGAHEGAAAYSMYPSGGASNPYADGVISLYDYVNVPGRENTIAHEVGHYLNLKHVFGDTNSPEIACGDDEVDDTPPTKGHYANGCTGGVHGNPTVLAIYDTACAINYQRAYTKPQLMALYGDSTTIPTVINYPDTTNSQNIMDYTYCSKMFTYGQVLRMRAALNSTIAGRNNLWQLSNLTTTGALLPTPDLAPIADFNPNRVFTCANTTGTNGQVSFTNRSWRDTVTSNSWTFTNANPATSTTANPANVLFTQIGWADVSLTATSNAGSGSVTKVHAVYAADPTPVSASGYFQEFDGDDTAMYPIFNYYNQNNYKWELYDGRGYFDQKCIRFKNYDPRTTYANNTITQTPGGLFADFFTRGFDLTASQFSSRGILSFYTAGAYRTTRSDRMNDTLEISYSTNCGASWVRLGVIGKSGIATKYEANEFTPGVIDDWKLQGLNLPAGAKTSKTFFRFRYKPGVDNTAQSSTYGIGTGNHFYLDRINITSNALGVNTAELAARGVTLAPNPTNGAATVTIKGGDRSTATVVVTDIAGKVVYRTEVKLNDQATSVEIPAEPISVKGMYLVQVVSNGNATTQKLVVY